MTTPDIEVDYDSVDSILDVIGRCLRVDRKLNQRKPWDGFVVVSGYEEGHSAHQAWQFNGDETRITTVSGANPAFNRALIARLRELTADPERGNWQTWIARYDLASDTFDHTFLWPGEDDGYNVLAYDTPMSTIKALNPAFKAE
ncbi:hypothetical protein [Pseudoglutamicibacter cumminsii]|uniref:DUF600 domain-containing protein n=1 Tax=Pseudoglutamicibacter cumminsii TaxID=156979 RepID=A0ABX5L5E1_9MICC|nr:hypothetical protein [Pseudoglutamicibacter cumminsii]PWI27389.1 hypothetical protein CAY35_07945 [Pseudoglutamicibacter cumminsii]